MTNRNNWSFENCSAWLSSKAIVLRDAGFLVDFQRNDRHRPSVRLRVEGQGRVGEVVVWEEGIAHEVVIDLVAGEYVHDQDGIQLDEDGELRLEGFLNKWGFKTSFPQQ